MDHVDHDHEAAFHEAVSDCLMAVEELRQQINRHRGSNAATTTPHAVLRWRHDAEDVMRRLHSPPVAGPPSASTASAAPTAASRVV